MFLILTWVDPKNMQVKSNHYCYDQNFSDVYTA